MKKQKKKKEQTLALGKTLFFKPKVIDVFLIYPLKHVVSTY